MLPLRFRRKDVDTLTWEYLDGEISPSRVQRLSRLLMEKVSARKRFVESAMMHGMLFEYFKNEAALASDESQADDMPRRRKRGRWSAA